MKNHIKLSLIAIGVIIVSSCASMRPIHLTKISIGMDKAEVAATLHKTPEIIGSKQYPKGLVEVQKYINTYTGNTEWFYFYNGKLVQFGKPTGNWITESDILVASR
jgi:hypothetical protein